MSFGRITLHERAENKNSPADAGLLIFLLQGSGLEIIF
jgi:hypothetical protein